MQNRNINVEPDLDIIAESLTLPFPLKEYQNRLNKVRKEMEARGIQMLYITSPESMYYISGLSRITGLFVMIYQLLWLIPIVIPSLTE